MSLNLKDKWIKDRTEELRKTPTTALIRLAEDNGIQIDDLTSIKHLARQIAEAEWAGQSKHDTLKGWIKPGSGPQSPDLILIDDAPWPGYPLADVTGVPFEEAESPKDEEVARLMAKQARGPQPQTSSGYFIYEVLLPEFLDQFLAKNADYGDQHRTGLGVKAEYVGIHRKVEKLKTALWDGQSMNGEGPREMLFDLIGQCFIVLDLMAQDQS